MLRSCLHPSAGRFRRLLLSGPVCLALIAPGIGFAGPSLEYGPEAETVFVLRCAGPHATAAAVATCHREMERLQSLLGYEAFLGHVEGVPGRTRPSNQSGVIDILPPRLSAAAEH
jgi:hypothetical protein